MTHLSKALCIISLVWEFTGNQIFFIYSLKLYLDQQPECPPFPEMSQFIVRGSLLLFGKEDKVVRCEFVLLLKFTGNIVEKMPYKK